MGVTCGHMGVTWGSRGGAREAEAKGVDDERRVDKAVRAPRRAVGGARPHRHGRHGRDGGEAAREGRRRTMEG
eukprot:367855-Prymnesium_polylepis.1